MMNNNNPDTFEVNDYFDPNSLTQDHIHHHHEEENSFLQPNFSNFHQIPNLSAIEAPENELHHHHHHHQQQQLNWIHNNQILIANDNDCLPNPPPDLLNFFQLPSCSSSSIHFSNPTRIIDQIQTTMYDPLLPLNLPPHPPFVKELLNSLPNGFNFSGCGSGFGQMDMDMDQNQLYHEGDSVMEFSGGINGNGKGKDNKHFASEKHRRQQFNGKFEALKELVPNPTKPDRASLVGYAIEYINELKRTVEKLKILVEKKRCNNRSRIKRRKTEEDSSLDVESIYTRSNGDPANDDQQAINGSKSSSSTIRRKSKNTEIDVRIVDDEVTIKLQLVQQKQKEMNCLLVVSKVLDELQLDLHNVAGGVIGDFYSYLFNSKICEGSSVYASAIANKIIEVVDKQYAT